MSRVLSRRMVLAGLMSSAAGVALAEAPLVSLRPVPRPGSVVIAPKSSDVRVAEAGLSGRTSFAVADASTGQVLETREADVPLPPASVAKAITALYALKTLGPTFRFETQVLTTAPVVDGVLEGDLILVGGGDPTLNSDDLGDLAAAVKATGLREVRGAFRIYDGAVQRAEQIDPAQPDYVGYNPTISGLNLNYNRVHFEWRRSGGTFTTKMDARAERFAPAVSVATMKIENRQTPVFTIRTQAGVDRWTVARGALGNGGARWLPVRVPALYGGDVFRTLMRSHGIVLPVPARMKGSVKGTALATHQSAPLIDLARDMLKFSTNLTAEILGLTASAQRLGRQVGIAASAREMSRWASAHMPGACTLVDHSGLGDQSRVTAGGLAQFMAWAANDAALRPLMKPVKMRNEDGRVIPDHPVEVAAKTGTLNFVSSLAGYLTAPDGAELVFAIISADLPRRAAIPLSEREAPKGGKTFAVRSRRLQQHLLQGWGQLYGS